MTPIQSLTDRNQLGAWLTENGLTGVAVEVGAKDGGNARQWISTWPGILHLIDPWEQQDPKVYKERQDWTNFDDCYKECQKLEAEFYPRVVLHKAYSPQEAEKFANESLDSVYVDGNHAFEPVYADLNAWWPKVKKGGLFCGHDDYTDTVFPAFCEVHDALKRFCAEKNLKYHRTQCTSWWIHK